MAKISKTPSGSYRGVFTSQPLDSVVDAVNNIQGNGTAGPLAATTLTATGFVGPAPLAAGATLTLTAAVAGNVIKLDTAAGSVVTLPAATGSGNMYRFVVTTTATSNAHKILTAPTTDTLAGFLTGENSGTAKCFVGATASAYHSIQMPVAGTQPSGGFEGDWFEFIDIASGKWEVSGCYQAGTTPTSPFSTATT